MASNNLPAGNAPTETVLAPSADDGAPTPAGAVSVWVGQIRRALAGQADSDVPCRGCTACCRAYQFIPVGPEDQAALARIRRSLLFPAPRRPRGHFVLGHDAQGRCPMLGDEGCSIYEHRPRACRAYDCRIFAATGVHPGQDRQPALARRVQRWRFITGDAQERRRHDALRAAADYLRAQGGPTGGRSRSPVELAVDAVRIHEAFLGPGDAARQPAPDQVARLLEEPGS